MKSDIKATLKNNRLRGKVTTPKLDAKIKKESTKTELKAETPIQTGIKEVQPIVIKDKEIDVIYGGNAFDFQ